jgi:biopolymer transport protein ExbB/TolQ
MSMSPVELWESMGWIARAVFILLVFLSVWMVAVSIERWLRFRKARIESLAFTTGVGPLLKRQDLEAAIALSKKYPGSHLAQVVGAGLLEFVTGVHGSTMAGHDQVAAATRAMERATVKISEEFKKGLNGLATTATTAPFIGLFGTVIGIINAFRGMAVTGSGGLGAVSAGIAEALVTTSLGLLVAIPAVWLYNYFLNKVDRFRVEMTNSGSELIDFFIRQVTSRQAA